MVYGMIHVHFMCVFVFISCTFDLSFSVFVYLRSLISHVSHCCTNKYLDLDLEHVHASDVDNSENVCLFTTGYKAARHL